MKKAKDSKIVKDILKKYDDDATYGEVDLNKEHSLKWLNKVELIYLLKELNKRYYELYNSDQWDGG